MKFKKGIILLMFLLLIPIVFSYSVEIVDGEITIFHKDYSVSFMPRFVMDSGTVFDYSEIPPSIYKLLWKEQISKNKFKYGVDFADISPNIKDNLKYIVLHRTGSSGLQWDDVRREGNSIVVKNKIRMTTDDIIGSGFTIAKINRTDIVIGNLEPNFIQQGDGNFILIIDPIIIITEAEHLNTSREFISDIYDEVSELDSVWSEEIYHNEYVRVVFEEYLTSENDITVYTRNTQSLNTTIEVYLEDSEEKIAEFEVLLGEDYHSVLLTSMTGTNDTFDLRIVNLENNPNAFLEFDHIIDPTPPCEYQISDCCSINSAGVYNLTTNISGTKDCLIIKSNDVLIQTMGFTISGDGGLTDYGIDNSMGKNNVIVNGGGLITNFGSAIYTDGDYGNFNNLTLYSNTDDAVYNDGDYNNFINLYIHSNTDKGINFGENSQNNIVENNNIINNAHGVYIYRGSMNNIVRSNDISGHSNTGIYLFGSIVPSYIKVENNSIINNTITSNSHHGIYFFNGHHNTIANNTIYSSGYNGIYFSYSSNNTVINNIIWNSSSLGSYASIYVSKSESNIFERNFVNLSYNYGIHLKSSETDKDSSHHLFKDMDIANIDSASVYIESSGGGQCLNNTFLNVTYNNESVSVNSELIRDWYYGASAYDLNYTPINNANLSYYNDDNVFQFKLVTDSFGYTEIVGIIDYFNTNDLKDYYSNYTIVFSRVGCIGNISNMTYNVSANLNNLNHSMQFNCVICVENPVNTSWSNWTNGECLSSDSFNQSRNRIEYDANLCGTFENVTHYDYNASESCNYCSGDINLYSTPLEDCSDITLEWNVSYYYIDDNFDTCCDITNISSDCNILNETLYVNYTQMDDCSILDCLYDATPYLKFFDKRIPLLCEVNKNASYGFLTYVKADEQIIQTNPERILIDRFGEYNTFQSVNGLVNLYYRSSILRPDRNITVIVEGQNGIFYEEMNVIPTYKDPYQLQDRLFWTWSNAGLIIGAIFMILIIGVLIVILIRRFAGEWKGW